MGGSYSPCMPLLVGAHLGAPKVVAQKSTVSPERFPPRRSSHRSMSSCKVAIKQSTAISSKGKKKHESIANQSILLKWGEFLPKTQFRKICETNHHLKVDVFSFEKGYICLMLVMFLYRRNKLLFKVCLWSLYDHEKAGAISRGP